MIDERIEIRGAVINRDTNFKDALIYDCYIDRCRINLDGCVMRGCIIVGSTISTFGAASEMWKNQFYGVAQWGRP